MGEKVEEVEKKVQEAETAQQHASAHYSSLEADVAEQQAAVQDATSNFKVQQEKIKLHADVIEALERLRRYDYDIVHAEVQAKAVEMVGEGAASDQVCEVLEPVAA